MALLADSAAVHDDGNRFHVLGGGIESLNARSFPFVHPNLAVVMKLVFGQTEWGVVHIIQVRITDDAGNEIQAGRPFSVVPQPPREVIPSVGPGASEQATVSLPIVHNIRDLQFPRPGRYAVSIRLPDESAEVSLPLQIFSSADEASLQSVLVSGYQAFVAGDIERAWGIFEEAIRTAPGSAAAHNDFGFLNLARGDAASALELFQRARELGYEFPELVDANLACCRYLIGNYDQAFPAFRHLMGEDLRNTPSVLFALDRQLITPVELHASVHFISLMALNAGFAALAAGSRDDAQQLAQIATAGRMTFTEEKDASSFVAALDHLIEDCQSRPDSQNNTAEA